MAIDESLEQTAISSDGVRGPAPAVAPGVSALAETHVSVQGSIVRDMTLRSDSPQVSVGPLPGQIGRYLVIRSIAAGGMGEVVEAFDPELDRRVALKLLKAGRGRDDSQARLLREAQAMARLSHPNVAQIYEVGKFASAVFIAMEFVAGHNLREWIERSARYFACVAYDFDARLYKMYRFKHRPVHYLEDLDLVERAAELPALAYIRSLELQVELEIAGEIPFFGQSG